MTGPLRDLATTRLASLSLNRRGRPRGLSYDDHLIRGALILDLAVVGETWPLLSAGATMVRAQDDEIEWDVLADPEGNEFCVFAPED